MTARPLPKHKPRTESARSARFRVLSAVLGFASEPLTNSLLIIAGTASYLGFVGMLAAAGMFFTMADLVNGGLSSLGAIVFGACGWLCFSRWL